MFYDAASKTLTMKEVEDLPITTNSLDAIKASYEKYRTETVYKDIEFFEDLIRKATKNEDFSIIPIVGPLYSSRSKTELRAGGDSYYPVCARFSCGQFHIPDDVELFRIPAMNSYCVLNVGGAKSILLSSLITKESIAFVNKPNERRLVVTLPNNMFFIDQNSFGKPFTFVLYSKEVDYNLILEGFMQRDLVSEDLHSIYTNALLTVTLSNPEEHIEAYRNVIMNQVQFLQLMSTEEFNLGDLRDVLDSKLTLDKCLGMTTSREIPLRLGGSIEKGTIITEEVLKKIKKNLVNCIHVRAVPTPIINTYLYAAVSVIRIPRGTRVSSVVEDIAPECKGMMYVPKDIVLDKPYYVDADTRITDKYLEFFYDCGIEEITTYMTKAHKDPVTYTFEQEFVGNYTMRKCDFIDGETSKEYVYYYDVYDPYTFTGWDKKEKLTAWDLISLVSLTARIKTMPELAETLHRELDFLKKLNTINDTFSGCMRQVMKEHVKSYRKQINDFITGEPVKKSPFSGLHSSWIRAMNKSTLLRPADDINPIALLSHVNKVVTEDHGAGAIDPALRSLAMSYYGRLCPYNTPSGKKTGLVNTLASGCIIKDDQLYTAYRVIKHLGNGKAVLTDKTIELKSTDEVNYRIADLQSLHYDKDGYIIDEQVLACVPAPLDPYEKIKVATISSLDVDLVNTNGCQHLSVTAMLIPFAAADDSIRLQFGLSLISQCIYVQRGEVPLVHTSMYQKMFDYADDYVVRAAKSGTVTAIEPNNLYVIYDGDEDETTINAEETKFYNKSTITMRYCVRPGQRFRKDDVLVDTPVSREGIFSPGANLMTAYMCWKGRNYEDAVAMSRSSTKKYVSITTDKEKIGVNAKDKHVHPREFKYFSYVSKGGTICNLHRESMLNKTVQSDQKWKSRNAEGILYKIKTAIPEANREEFTAYLLGFNQIEVGDKTAGRHGNKGVLAFIEEDYKMPIFKNGYKIELLLNLTGVPSRMNPGQLLDAEAGMVAYLLGIRISTEAFNGASTHDINRMMEYAWACCNIDDIEEVFRKYPDIAAILREQTLFRLPFLRKWKGCFNPDCTAYLYNQETGKMFPNPIGIGMPYYLKIHKDVDDYQYARAGGIDEEYAMSTSQATEGASSGGGQKQAEMEFAGLAAHGAAAIIDEDVNEKSDNVGRRMNALQNSLGYQGNYTDPDKCCPRTADTFRYYMEAGGVKVDITNYPGVGPNDILSRYRYKGMYILKSKNKSDEHLADSREVDDSDIDALLKVGD